MDRLCSDIWLWAIIPVPDDCYRGVWVIVGWWLPMLLDCGGWFEVYGF